MTLPKPSYFPKVPLQIPSHWRLGLQHMKFEGTKTFSPQWDLIVFGLTNVLVFQDRHHKLGDHAIWAKREHQRVGGRGWEWARAGNQWGMREGDHKGVFLSPTKESLAHDDSKKQISFKSISLLILCSLQTMCLYLLHGWGHSQS